MQQVFAPLDDDTAEQRRAYHGQLAAIYLYGSVAQGEVFPGAYDPDTYLVIVDEVPLSIAHGCRMLRMPSNRCVGD